MDFPLTPVSQADLGREMDQRSMCLHAALVRAQIHQEGERVASEVAVLVARMEADVAAAEVIARASRSASDVASRVQLPGSPSPPPLQQPLAQLSPQISTCTQPIENADPAPLPPYIVSESRKQRAQRLRRTRQRQEAAEDRRVRALQRKLQRSRTPSVPQLEHAPPSQPPSLHSSVAPQPRSQPRQSPRPQGPSLLPTPTSPARAPSASSSASEFSMEAVETVTLQEGGQQDESCPNRCDLLRTELDISTDPLANTDSSSHSVIELGDSQDDSDDPMSELSTMQMICDGQWEGSDVEGSPTQEYPESISPEYVPPGSSYTSSPVKTEVIDLAGSEDEEAGVTMEQGEE